MRTIIIIGAMLGFGTAALGQSASEIQTSLIGKRVTLSCADGTRGSGRYTMGTNVGTIRGKYQKPDGSITSDIGKVRVDGDQLCLTFRVLNDGQEQCFGVRSTGKGQFAITAAAGLVTACQVASR